MTISSPSREAQVTQVIAEIKAELSMVADLIVHPASDPLVMLARARRKVYDLEAALGCQETLEVIRCPRCRLDYVHLKNGAWACLDCGYRQPALPAPPQESKP